ncbi:hypothetical protein PDIDSM_995 [Penicillium digitatum]|nr:hypothetical protein PDIDSM_995 [Penicillium digitatum]
MKESRHQWLVCENLSHPTCNHEFPSVRSEVITRLKDSMYLLQSLGAQREIAEQQRMILLDVVSAFQEITQHVLATNGGANDMFDEDKDLRLATLVSLRNDVFSHNFAYCGHAYTFGRNWTRQTAASMIVKKGTIATDTEAPNTMQSRKAEIQLRIHR